MNIVLFEPEIPANTGNISRTCVLTGTTLHLIKPLGFSIEDKALKRAGLDYWDLLDLRVYENFEEFLDTNPDAVIYALTKKADHYFHEVDYPEDVFLLFGRETTGLPDEVMAQCDQRLRIPMIENDRARCLNLSNAAAVCLYHALETQGFRDMI